MANKRSGNKIIYELQHSKIIDGKHKATKDDYKRKCGYFATWLESNGVKRMKDFSDRDVQIEWLCKYRDYLLAQGKTQPTVHSYINAVCVSLGLRLEEIPRMKRISAETVKGRDPKRGKRGRQEIESGKYDKSVQFQRVVGIRRNELRNLTGRDFRKDEHGHWCVVVQRGKGGKEQWQIIPDSQVDFIRGYFWNKNPEEKIFSEEELANHINYHAMRAESGRLLYQDLIRRFQENPEYREILIQELKDRYIHAHGKDTADLESKKFFKELDQMRNRKYCLRGDNRKLAIKLGLPVEYDRVALMAVSVLKLSHWRLDVTVGHYMLGKMQSISEPGSEIGDDN